MIRVAVFFFCALLALPAQSAERPGRHAVASAHPLATQAGMEILQAGGNAFDAAVAVSSALAVVEPTGSGFGGGGFWLLHRAGDGFETMIDGRETAPAAATEDMYLDAQGKAVPARSRDGALAAAIPGQAAALAHLAQTYGRLPLASTLAPAIRYAREGFACDDKLAEAFAQQWKRFSPAAQAVFAVGGSAPAEAALLRQPELAQVLERFAKAGRAGFYEGETAERLVAGVRAGGGIWSAEDLRRYSVIERTPVEIWFRDLRIVSAPPPSAGGITLGETLGQLEALGWSAPRTAQSAHLVVEALRRGYRDRAAWLGDPAFVRIPGTRLLSTGYARGLAASVAPDRATPSANLPVAKLAPEGPQTTHFSVLDAEGNRVAATLSINLPFGSGFMAEGTGIFLNDEMDDFSAKVDASNAYGLIGSVPNRIEPGKRPLSSMSPTFAEGPRGLLILGTPGGSRIISMVLLGVLAWSGDADAQEIVTRARFHHQYLPDEVLFEPGAFDSAQAARLQAMGHKLKESSRQYGNMQAITWNPANGEVRAASDPRGVGAAKVSEALQDKGG